MPFVPADNGAEARLKYHFLGQDMENVLHFKNDPGWDSADLDTLATDLANWYDAHMKPSVSSALNLYQVITKSLASDTEPGHVLPVNVTGTAATDPMPGNVTAVASLYTSFSGRSFRGRIYHVGLVENYVSGNQLTTSARDGILTAYDFLLNTATITVGALAVCSKYSAGAPRSVCLLSTVIGIAMNLDIDSQRRRLAGRGR